MKKILAVAAFLTVTAAFATGCRSGEMGAADKENGLEPVISASETLTETGDKPGPVATGEAGASDVRAGSSGATGSGLSGASGIEASGQDGSYESHGQNPVTVGAEDTVSFEDRLDDPEYRRMLEETRHEAWCSSFLVWLPEFTCGAFMGTSSDDMTDYAMFSVVGGRESVLDYIEDLKQNGFTADDSLTVDELHITYSALSKNGWHVELDYDAAGDVMRVGADYCGLAEENPVSETDEVWSSSLLMYVPVFMSGRLESHSDEYDDGRTSVAVFDSVAAADADEYISFLKLSGYTFDREESSDGDMKWYMASSDDGIFCDFRYSDGICRIAVTVFDD